MRARRGASTVVALFLVVWLNMALQPCLMAAEPLLPDEQHDCPHCPPPAGHCDESADRCGFIGGFDYDGRSPASPDLSHGLAAVPAMSIEPLPASTSPACRPLRNVWPGAGPPLHVRNCVYLN